MSRRSLTISRSVTTRPLPGAITDFTVEGDDPAYLGFTWPSNAQYVQYRVEGGDPILLPQDRTLRGFTIPVNVELRGANVEGFGAWSEALKVGVAVIPQDIATYVGYSFGETNTDNKFSIALPSGTQSGDLMVALLSCMGTAGTTSAPVGWTHHARIEQGEVEVDLFTKQATLNESSPQFTNSGRNTFGSTHLFSGTLISFRPIQYGKALTVETVLSNQGVGPTTISPTITTEDHSRLLLAFDVFSDDRAATLQPGSWTQRFIRYSTLGDDVTHALATIDANYQGTYVGTTYTRSSVATDDSVRFTVAIHETVKANEAPVTITLSNLVIGEDDPVGTVLGTLSTIDADANDLHTYTLTSQSSNNFVISGNQIVLFQPLIWSEFATQTLYVRATDRGGLMKTEMFEIEVVRAYEAPYVIYLSNNSAPENSAAGTQIGVLSTEHIVGYTYTYSIVSSSANMFAIFENKLRVASSSLWNYEVRQSETVVVRVTDNTGATFDQQFTVYVTNVNEAPTNLSLSATAIPETAQIGDVVATITTTDPDAGDSHTYSLVTDGDNKFIINGNQIKLKAGVDWSLDTVHSITLRATDALGLYHDQIFSFTVSRVYYPPTNITLSATSVNEDLTVGGIVASISATDVNVGDQHTFVITADTDAKFAISGSNLVLTNALNFETKTSHPITIRADDPKRGSFSKSFTITVNNVNEIATAIALDNLAVDTQTLLVGVLSTSGDPDAGETFVYTIVSDATGAFLISGNQLRHNGSVAGGSHPVTVRSTDAGGLYIEQTFTIEVTAVNGYAAETSTLFTAMTTQPDDTRKGHIDTLTVTLKLAGVWELLDIFYIMAAHDEQAARLNWVTPGTYSLIDNSANLPVFYPNNGFMAINPNKLNTQFNPSDSVGRKLSQNDQHMSYYLDCTGVGSAQPAMGTTTNYLQALWNTSSNTRVGARLNTTNTTPTIYASPKINNNIGMLTACRTGASSVAVYFNGTQKNTGSTVSAAFSNAQMRIGGTEAAGVGIFGTTNRWRMVSVGRALTDQQVTDLYSAVHTYMTALGVQL